MNTIIVSPTALARANSASGHDAGQSAAGTTTLISHLEAVGAQGVSPFPQIAEGTARMASSLGDGYHHRYEHHSHNAGGC